jgi:hypothetical protein
MSKTVEVISNIYLVACTALEGFLVGWCVDFMQKRNTPSSKRTGREPGI